MNEQIAAGGKVYVHCKAGRARSATVAMCWLMKAKNMSAEEAQQFGIVDQVVEKRPGVDNEPAAK